MAYGLTESINFASASSEYAAMGADSASLSVTGTDDITLEGWFNITSQPATGASYFLIWKSTGAASNRGYELNYEDQAGTKVLTARFFAGGGVTNFWTGSCTYTLTTDVWYHIAVTIDVSASVNSKCVFYVNGVSQSKSEANTGTGATAIFDSTTPFSIGQSIPVLALPQYYSNMNVSLVRVWNTIRSGTDIADNMCNVLGPTTNLQGEWTFGNTYVDTSGNGNTLSGVNTPTFIADLPSTCPITFGSFKTATVNASDVPATQTDFPAYVDLSRIGITTLAEAQSVRVYADDTMTIEWAREIVSATEMHVKVPSLTSTTPIYIAWSGGNADYAVTDTYGRNAVWSDYARVYHMEEGSGNRVDSTGNVVLTGTTRGAVASFIGNGNDFEESSSDYLTSANTGLVNVTDLSIEICFRAESFTDTYPVLASVWRDNVDSRAWALAFIGSNLYFYVSDNGANSGTDQLASAVLSTATNYYVTCTFDGAATSVFNTYINTVNYTKNSTVANSVANETTTLQVGHAEEFGGVPTSSYFDGTIDELRIRIGVLSANWDTTRYNNQSDEAGFWGAWSDVGGTNTTNFFVMM